MSSNETESVSDCTTESNYAEFHNVCALESDSSSGSRFSSADDHVDYKPKIGKKYCAVKTLTISPPQFLNNDLNRRRSSPAGLDINDIKTAVDQGFKKTSVLGDQVYKKASVSGVNFNLSIDDDFLNTNMPLHNELGLSEDNAITGSKFEQNSFDTTPGTSRKSCVSGVVKHMGRRYRTASRDKVTKAANRGVRNTSLDQAKTLPVFTPMPPKEKTSADNFLMQSIVNRMHDGDNTLIHKQPPSIDIISPSPTLSTMSNNLGKSTPTSKAIVSDYSQPTKSSMLSIKSSTSNDWLSSGSSSGTISPISGILRCPSSTSNSNSEGRSPLPPLKNTPVLRRRNLLPPICRQGTLSPSSCSSHGSGSRTPSPASSKLQSPVKDNFGERSPDHSPPFYQRTHNLSPLMQYIISQQSIHHIPVPEQTIPLYEPSASTPQAGASEHLMTSSSRMRRERIKEHGNDSEGSSPGSLDAEKGSLTSTSSLEVAPRSPEQEFQRTSHLNTMLLPDIRPKDSVKYKVFDVLASDSCHLSKTPQRKGASGSSDMQTGRRSSRKLSLLTGAEQVKESRTRINSEDLFTTHKKTCSSSKSFDIPIDSPVSSPVIRRKITRKEDRSIACFLDKKHSQPEMTQNDLGQLLQIKTLNLE